MTLLQLIEHVGDVRNYCQCLKEYTQIRLNAITGKQVPAEYKRKFYQSGMTVEYYIMNMSRFKVKRAYNRKAT